MFEIVTVLEYSLRNPYEGKDAVSAKISSYGTLKISASQVARIWKTIGIETKDKRLLAVTSIENQRNPIFRDLIFRSDDIKKAFETKLKTKSGRKFIAQLHPTSPAQWGIYDIVKLKTDLDLYQHIFIDAYTLMAFSSISREISGQASEEFLSHEVFPFYLRNNLKIENLYVLDEEKFKTFLDYYLLIEYLEKNGLEEKYKIIAKTRPKDDGILGYFNTYIKTNFLANIKKNVKHVFYTKRIK